MTDDTLLPFAFPAVCAKKVTAAFDGGRITSDGGGMLRIWEVTPAAGPSGEAELRHVQVHG